jgi:CRP/FNR family transcriptional regulator
MTTQTASIQLAANGSRPVGLGAIAAMPRKDTQTPREDTMAATTATLEKRTRLEDVLEHLPISGTAQYRKGQRIYGPDAVSKSIYLVVTGTVGISQIAEDGRELLLELVRPDELFGESAFIEDPSRFEKAMAIERAELMSWAVSDMEALVVRRPPLALALLQFLAQRNASLTRRIESLSIDTVERRLARSLIRLSERLGTPEQDGAVRMMPFTHVLLSRYVGTTREIVTQHMNRFRKQGYVSYSRRGILLYRGALKTVLDRRGVSRAAASS